MSGEARKLVEEGYDGVAEAYLATKDSEDEITLVALEEMSKRLSRDSAVLDLGCGAGVPATRWLAERFALTGVEFSEKQIELARQNVPDAALTRVDMMEVDFESESFDAVVALHSLIHVPRSEHQALVKRILRWLKPGGLFLATWAVGAWEGREEDWEGWGAPMLWSHHDGKTSLEMLRNSGFEIASAEDKTSGGTGGEETWLWVLARKPT